ncbi:MAG: sugar phosphate isomerase/epimerase family protein [Bacteroidota bacterium]|nr:sugar phosphate isomerase/epimerase family protein [Bacteroidota bacterium]
MVSEIKNLDKLCIHTITTKPLGFEVACAKYAALGVKGISIWRDAVAGLDPRTVVNCLRANRLRAVSYVRGGFFPALESGKRAAAIEDNIRMLEEAAAMEIPMLVLVCGADPGQSLPASRDQIKAGIEAILPRARELHVKLAIEPLHPMYADTRSAITSLKQANELTEFFQDEYLGVAVDVYHLWFDEDLEQQIRRCGKNQKLFAYHICDWKIPTTDMLNDRGLMGEGCIPLKQIRAWVEEAGFTGFHEVEIFSTRFWEGDQDLFLDEIVRAYLKHS